MTLDRLTINNFKGIEHFELALDSLDADIYGDNATGKTTVFDAIQWLLFGKDGAGRSDFEVKPLGEDGKTKQAGIEVCVEGVIVHNGRSLELRRSYAEKWSRPRGSVQPIFTGHITQYYVDGLPVTQGEYRTTIDGLIPEKLFRLLTNPFYFSKALKWQERREILFAMCGEVTDADILESDPRFLPLADALPPYTVDDFRKVTASRLKKANQELKALPVRIDEANRSIVTTGEPAVLRAQLDGLNARRRAIEEMLSTPDTSALENQKSGIKARLAELRSEATLKAEQERLEWELERGRRLDEARSRLDAIDGGTDEVAAITAQISIMKSEQRDLREEWLKLDDAEPPIETACPTCGRPYDGQAAILASIEAYNIQKSKRLEAITMRGQQIGVDIAALELKLQAAEENAKRIRSQQDIIKAEIKMIQGEVPPDIRPDMPSEAQALEAKLIGIQSDIDAIRAGADRDNAEIRSKLSAVESEIRAIMSQLAQHEQNTKTMARIDELLVDQKQLAKEMERLEKLQALAEDFVREKACAIQAKINSMFGITRFKLFDEQINGGLTDACEATVGGVPFGDLNHAMQINVGLDIIRTLGRYYGVSAPVIVDNAESVTALEPMDCQLIRLIVNEDDKALRVALR